MLPSRRSLAAEVCWKCQCRLFGRPNVHAAASIPTINRNAVARVPRRALHATAAARTQPAVSSDPTPTLDPSLYGTPTQRRIPIRQYLQQWHQDFGGPAEVALQAFGNHPVHGDIQNNVSKLSYDSKANGSDGSTEFDERDPDQESADDGLLTIGLFLKPGDVVELSMPGHEPVLAVYVQQLEYTCQFFSATGRWNHASLATITFVVQGCIDPTSVTPLIPYLPTNPMEAQSHDPVPIPREVAAPVQRLLNQLSTESERIYRTNASVLDTAYTVLADANRTRMMTLDQIAKSLFGRRDPAWTSSPPALLAVRKALNHNAYRFRADARSQRLTNVFAIRPKTEVEVVETVQEWTREYNEYEASLVHNNPGVYRSRSNGAMYIQEFLEKSRRLVAASRKQRAPNAGFIGPSQARFPLTEQESLLRVSWGEEFTEADRRIISFIQAWVLMDQFRRMPNLHSACTSILHATGCYGPDVIHNNYALRPGMGRNTGHLFLQEIGVITPHENRILFDEQLMLPTSRLSRNMELLNSKAELIRRNPDFRDQMADLRRDWGSTTIFCIDDANAKEIDDGVSVERVPGKESEFWVHAHIANPTAFFDKSHVLSGLAAHMTETLYTPERSFAMLPAWVSQNYFSLRPNRPVITFSTRLDAGGNIVETKIQHGIVRKVVSLTYTEFSACLGESTGREIVRTVVGGQVPANGPSRTPPQLSAEQLQNAKDLYAAAKVIWKGRKAAGGVRMNATSTEVRIYENANQSGLGPWSPSSLDRSRVVQGDPIIELITRKSKNSIQDDIDSASIIEEMMLLACMSAASWCAERNLPVMFRGTVQVPSAKYSLEQFQEQVMEPYLQKHGTISLGIGYRYIDALGRSVAHTSPLPHKLLGAKAYVKVTSPLRRFSDMIAHWQIEAAIRYEARTGKKLNSALLANATRPILPFSQRQVQESIVTLSPREKLISGAKRSSTQFWITQAFMRAFHYNQAPLPVPDNFMVSVRWQQDSTRDAVGYIEDLAIKVWIINVAEFTFESGDQWEVKMHHVDVFGRALWVMPIRLLRRDENFGLE